MEYRQRRKSRSHQGRARSRSKRTGGAGSFIVSLILIAGLVYVAVTSSIGEWVAREVMAPLFTAVSNIGSLNRAATDADTNVSTDNDSIDLSSGKTVSTKSANAQFAALNCYMLQMGVFSSSDNAQKEADRLRSLGAAGYIVTDDSSGETRYRVMASGYADEQSAKSVKERLYSEGIDTAVYLISSPEASFKITADDDSIDNACAAFSSFYNAVDGLSSAAIRFDKESMSISGGKQLCTDILNSLDEKLSTLSTYSNEGSMLGEILSAYSDCKAQLSNLCETEYESTVDFSAALKYTHLYVASRYATMVRRLSAQ